MRVNDTDEQFTSFEVNAMTPEQSAQAWADAPLVTSIVAVRTCVECGRELDAAAAEKAPRDARLVCDAHVEAGALLARRKVSTLRMLAAKHGGFVAMVPVAPTVEAER